MADPRDSSVGQGREWPRAAALFFFAATTSVVQPAVLIAFPFLALLLLSGVRGLASLLAVGVATFVAIGGVRDGFWYMERAWALVVAGWFLAYTVRRPAWRFAQRGIAAVLSGGVTVGLLLAVRAGGWSAVDWAVEDRVRGGIATFLDVAAVVRDGEPMSAALVAAMYEIAETQLEVFPALTAIATIACLGVAWWAYVALLRDGRPALGPLRDFRFNDHFVWIFLGGLALLLAGAGESLRRVGINAVVFMGALYALRGAAVVVFMSGGFSWFGRMMTVLALLLMPPVVLGAAMVIGIGDTWLGVRDRVRELSA